MTPLEELKAAAPGVEFTEHPDDCGSLDVRVGSTGANVTYWATKDAGWYFYKKDGGHFEGRHPTAADLVAAHPDVFKVTPLQELQAAAPGVEFEARATVNENDVNHYTGGHNVYSWGNSVVTRGTSREWTIIVNSDREGAKSHTYPTAADLVKAHPDVFAPERPNLAELRAALPGFGRVDHWGDDNEFRVHLANMGSVIVRKNSTVWVAGAGASSTAAGLVAQVPLVFGLALPALFDGALPSGTPGFGGTYWKPKVGNSNPWAIYGSNTGRTMPPLKAPLSAWINDVRVSVPTVLAKGDVLAVRTSETHATKAGTIIDLGPGVTLGYTMPPLGWVPDRDSLDLKALKLVTEEDHVRELDQILDDCRGIAKQRDRALANLKSWEDNGDKARAERDRLRAENANERAAYARAACDLAESQRRLDKAMGIKGNDYDTVFGCFASTVTERDDWKATAERHLAEVEALTAQNELPFPGQPKPGMKLQDVHDPGTMWVVTEKASPPGMVWISRGDRYVHPGKNDDRLQYTLCVHRSTLEPYVAKPTLARRAAPYALGLLSFAASAALTSYAVQAVYAAGLGVAW